MQAAEETDTRVGLLFDLTVGEPVASGLTGEAKVQYRGAGTVEIEAAGQRIKADYSHVLFAIGLAYHL